MDIKILKRLPELLFVSFPDWLVNKLGVDKIVHGLLAMYFISIFDDYGVIPGVLAFIVILAVGLLREKLSAKPDYSDVTIMFYFGFLELVRYCLVAMAITEGFGYGLQFI